MSELHIFDLPPEILEHITTFIDIKNLLNLTETCTTFYSILTNAKFYTELKDKEKHKKLFKPSLHQIKYGKIYNMSIGFNNLPVIDIGLGGNIYLQDNYDEEYKSYFGNTTYNNYDNNTFSCDYNYYFSRITDYTVITYINLELPPLIYYPSPETVKYDLITVPNRKKREKIKIKRQQKKDVKYIQKYNNWKCKQKCKRNYKQKNKNKNILKR